MSGRVGKSGRTMMSMYGYGTMLLFCYGGQGGYLPFLRGGWVHFSHTGVDSIIQSNTRCR